MKGLSYNTSFKDATRSRRLESLLVEDKYLRTSQCDDKRIFRRKTRVDIRSRLRALEEVGMSSVRFYPHTKCFCNTVNNHDLIYTMQEVRTISQQKNITKPKVSDEGYSVLPLTNS